MSLPRQDFKGLLVHAGFNFSFEKREAEHHHSLGGLNLALKRRFHARFAGLFRPVHDLEQPLAHYAVVFARELHALLDLRAIGFNKRLSLDLVGEFGEVLAGERALELFSSCLTTLFFARSQVQYV